MISILNQNLSILHRWWEGIILDKLVQKRTLWGYLSSDLNRERVKDCFII